MHTSVFPTAVTGFGNGWLLTSIRLAGRAFGAGSKMHPTGDRKWRRLWVCNYEALPGQGQGGVTVARLPSGLLQPVSLCSSERVSAHASSSRAESSSQGQDTFPPRGPAQDNQCAIRLVWTWKSLPESGLQLLRGALSEGTVGPV